MFIQTKAHELEFQRVPRFLHLGVKNRFLMRRRVGGVPAEGRKKIATSQILMADSEVVDGVPEGTSDGSARIQDAIELS